MMDDSWDPQQDADATWLAIRDALCDAEIPPPKSTVDWEMMRASIRTQLAEEGLLRESGTAQVIPVENIFIRAGRTLISGGGMAGQLVRLSAVAAASALFVVSLQSPDTDRRTQREQASAPPPSIAFDAPMEKAKDERDSAPPGRGGREMAAVPSTPMADETTMGLEHSGNYTTGAEFSVPAGALAKSSEAPRSVVSSDNFGSVRSWRDTAPATNAFQLSVSATPVSRTKAEAEANSTAELIGNSLDQLQAIKLDAILREDTQTITRLRAVEQMLSAAITDSAGGDDSPRHEVAALERFRRGEEAVSQNRLEDAVDFFLQARALAPRTLIGFLGQSQAARIEYERMRDYAEALTSYRVLLNEYPDEFLTPDYREHILERVQLITKTSVNEWKDLDLWLGAMSAPGTAACAEQLRMILQRFPQGPLAPDAADHLAQLALADSATQHLVYEEVVDALVAAVEDRGVMPGTAVVQFALAEVVYRRGLDPHRGLVEYRKVLSLGPSAELRDQINTRLRSIANQRMTLGSEPINDPEPARY